MSSDYDVGLLEYLFQMQAMFAEERIEKPWVINLTRDQYLQLSDPNLTSWAAYFVPWRELTDTERKLGPHLVGRFMDTYLMYRRQ